MRIAVDLVSCRALAYFVTGGRPLMAYGRYVYKAAIVLNANAPLHSYYSAMLRVTLVELRPNPWRFRCGCRAARRFESRGWW
jgi:hypothetical protein